MKVALILPMSQSPFRHFGISDHIQMSGLLSIFNYLKAQGHVVQVFDFLATENQNSEALYKQLIEFFPQTLVISAMFKIEDVAVFLNKITFLLPRLCTVCVGTGALDYQLCLATILKLDYVIPVEPEPVLAELLMALQLDKEGKIHNIDGLAYRAEGTIQFSPRRITPLGEIMDAQENDDSTISIVSPSTAYIWGSRGCWYANCTFCTVGAASRHCKGNGWSPRDLNSLVSQIDYFAKKGVFNFHFLDAEFIGPSEKGKLRAQEFAKLIIDKRLNISFDFDARPDSIQEGTFKILKTAGLKSVFIGIESCSQNILDRLNKGISTGEIIECVKILRRLKIPFRIGWLLAEPQTLLEEVEESVKLACQLRLFDGMGISNLSDLSGVNTAFHELHLHAGTPIYKQFKGSLSGTRQPESEIACVYQDERIARLIELSRPFRREITKREQWYLSLSKNAPESCLTHPAFDANWAHRYKYSLKVLAFYGLKILIDNLLAENWSTKDLEALINQHDSEWLKTSFDTLTRVPQCSP